MKHEPKDDRFPAVIASAVQERLHVNRTAGRDRHHGDSGGPVAAGFEPGKTQGAGNTVHGQSPAVMPGLEDVLG